MSYVLDSSSSIFSGILNNVNHGLSCQFRNSSSLKTIPLKNINVLIVDNDLDKKLWNYHINGSFEPITNAPPTTTATDDSLNIFDNDDDYDYDGALIYIIFILIFYSLSVILMILIQTKKSELYNLDESNGFDGTAARNVFKRIRSENIEREALGINYLNYSYLNKN